MAHLIAPAAALEQTQTYSYNGGYILLISAVSALGGVLFGFDTAIISGTIPFTTGYFGLDEVMLGWAVSSILIGCGLGALIAGRLADFAASFSFPLLNKHLGTSATLSLFALFCIIYLVYIKVRVPETKRKTLEELETQLTGVKNY